MIKTIHFAGGCFWRSEHFFKQIEGVTFTETVYANGNTPSPTYKEVYTDTTGYAETVLVEYDEAVTDLKFLVEMFFKAIDPTSLNKQGEDRGTRYRTGIYYSDPADLAAIRSVYEKEAQKYEVPVVVELEPLKNYYSAEAYHQDYLEKNPDGYCHLPVELFEFARSISGKGKRQG